LTDQEFLTGKKEGKPVILAGEVRIPKLGSDHLTEYAGAQHVFDWMMLKTPMKIAQGQTARNCQLEEAADGRIINSNNKQTFGWNSDSCVERGVTIGYNAQAHSEAQKAVRELVIALLKPK